MENAFLSGRAVFPLTIGKKQGILLVENGSVKYGKYDGIVKKKVGDDWIKMYYIHDDLICSEFVKENENVSKK